MTTKSPGPGTTSASPKALVGVLTLTVSLVIAGIIVGAMAIGRNLALRIEEGALSGLSETLASRTEGLFRQIDFGLKTLDLWILDHPGMDPRANPEFSAFVETFQDSLGSLVDVRGVSPTGGLYDIPAPTLRSPVSVDDRRYFLVQKDPRTRGFFVGEAIRDRLTGHWTLPVSYPVSADKGSLSVLVAFIDLERLLYLYRSFVPANGGALFILGQDGHIMADLPFTESDFTKSLELPAGLRRHMGEHEGDSIQAKGRGPDGRSLMFSYHSLGFPNLVVALASDPKVTLRPWRNSLPHILGSLVLAIGLIIVLAIKINRSLGELDASKRELEASVRSLEESRAGRDKLFSIISHDLRSPIGGMKNLLETLRKERAKLSEEDLEESVSALAEAADSTYRLLEDLLLWSRSQRHSLLFRPRLLPLRPIVDEVLDSLSASLAAKSIEVLKDIEEGCPVYADEDMVAAMLRNLLSNAVKYSEAGGRVAIEARAGRDEVRIVVRDEGRGMDEETRQRLFSAAQISLPGTAGERGSGLGLQVVKDFVDRHGGSIRVQSEVGAGSSFELCLPAKAPA